MPQLMESCQSTNSLDVILTARLFAVMGDCRQYLVEPMKWMRQNWRYEPSGTSCVTFGACAVRLNRIQRPKPRESFITREMFTGSFSFNASISSLKRNRVRRSDSPPPVPMAVFWSDYHSPKLLINLRIREVLQIVFPVYSELGSSP